VPNIFLIQNQKLLEMREQQYDSEELLQQLLAEHPSILAGDQFDRARPTRWLLVTREAGVPDGDAAKDRWSLDHLFLDQDGVPTLVEVKRSSDSRIRREVVGQMLDYAANSVAYWPVGQIRSIFETTCEADHKNPGECLSSFISTESGDLEGTERIDAFWQRVDTNLKAGKIRLVFVADQIPPELRRIVEFLNTQMDPAEVLAIEIRQFVGAGVKTLVPTVIGQTAQAQVRKGSELSSARWDRDRFMSALRNRCGDSVVLLAEDLLSWSEQHSTRIGWGEGARYGSCLPIVEKNGVEYYPYFLWTYGRIEIECKWMHNRPPFNDDKYMGEWVQRLNEIPGVEIRPEDWSRLPSFKMELLKDPQARQAFESAMLWFWRQL
jgi:hypothetical protein